MSLHLQGPSEQKPIINFGENERGRIQELPNFLVAPISQERVRVISVGIFATLSCFR